ncbi:MAG: hypothetical protein HZA35_02590 [Parcubacteria group bacterium]|nr:hypothetical protein [Parcubacteria group bacterium]
MLDNDKEHLIFDIKPKHMGERAETPIEELYKEEEQEETHKKLGFLSRLRKKEKPTTKEKKSKTKPEPEPELEEEEQEETIPEKKSYKKILIITSIFIVGFVILYIGTAVLPKAMLTIHAKRVEKSIKAAATASTEITSVDIENQKIPARVFVFKRTLTKEYPTSKQTVTQKATGVITIYNAYSGASQRLVATTRFRSPNGKIFRINTSVTIPGAKIGGGSITPSSIDVPVTADKPGAEYNMEPTTFTIPGFEGSPKYKGFYGKSARAMAGGSQGNAQGVNDLDIQKGKADLVQGAKELLMTELTEKSKGYIFMDGATVYKVAGASTNHKLGELAPTFQLTGTVELRAIGFKEDDVKILAKKLLEAQPDAKEFIDLSITYGTLRVNDNITLAAFSYDATSAMREKIDTEELKTRIRGKGMSEMKSILAKYDSIANAKVSLWPFWVTSVPTNKDKIGVTID